MVTIAKIVFASVVLLVGTVAPASAMSAPLSRVSASAQPAYVSSAGCPTRKWKIYDQYVDTVFHESVRVWVKLCVVRHKGNDRVTAVKTLVKSRKVRGIELHLHSMRYLDGATTDYWSGGELRKGRWHVIYPHVECYARCQLAVVITINKNYYFDQTAGFTVSR
ncbi:MAG TPA: hypothetical protein PKV52_03280 [Candidatus Saccharibacteria bacterium]|nr:hypothetical protein [Candidatus Nomurabacteria bacterium]HPD99268.1 hypothetical protein [Candidatus Saccharibacteria bacterium]